MYVNGTLPSAYFKYGYTPDNRSLHWYNFAYAGTTGAQFIPSNQAGVPNQVVLHFVDGQRGDDDLAINGSIDEPGAPAVRIFATPATAFVTSSYELVLEREPTSDELRYWTHRLAQGVPRLRVIRAIWRSIEHRRIEVDQLYQTFLHRPPDPAGRSFWVRVLESGMSETAVAVRFLTSAEYQRAHPKLKLFVKGLQTDALGQPAHAASATFRRLES
jgi:hypothetical protein